MITQELIDFIKKEYQDGKKQEEIKDALLKTGWQETDVDLAINQIFTSPQPPSPSASLSTPAATKFLGPIELLKNSLEIFKRRYKTLIAIFVIPIMIYVILGILAAIGGIATVMSAFAGSPFTILFIPVFIIIIITITLISIWSQIALLFSIKDQLGIKESYKKAWHKILSYWWVSILTGFIVLGGFLLFVIPGIVFSLWFSFGIYILINEDIKGLSALLKSKEYVKGRWWGVLLRFIFLGLIYLAFYIIIIMLNAFKLKTISNIISILGYLIFTPVVMIYMYKIYENLKSLKGEFAFSPTKKSKVVFSLFGVLGFLIIPLGIGAAILLIAINPVKQMNAARDSSRIFAVSNIRTGIEMYKVNKGHYPASLKEMEGAQIKTVPVDPVTKQPYKYRSINNGSEYELCADFESKPDQCFDSRTPIYSYPGNIK